MRFFTYGDGFMLDEDWEGTVYNVGNPFSYEYYWENFIYT